MSKKHKKRVKVHYFRLAAAVVLLALIVKGVSFMISSYNDKNESDNSANNIQDSDAAQVQAQTDISEDIADTTDESENELESAAVAYPTMSDSASTFPVDFDAKYGVLLDADSNEIIAYRNYNTRMYPASLTKIMTLIVAVENIDDLSDTVTITADMVDPMIEQEASRAGFVAGETPTLEQVLYGIILPSGGDAVLAAAAYVAGSEDAFVELMNQKAAEMGLKNTHFTNAVGLHDIQHYSTAEDIAVILEYALQNETCKEVLSTYQYQIPPTEYNPDGLLLTSTVFSRMEGTEMPGVVIKGGKTGYTDEAGQCLATFAEANGKTYIMVFSGGTSKWKIVYNTLSGYSIFCVGGEAYVPPDKKED